MSENLPGLPPDPFRSAAGGMAGRLTELWVKPIEPLLPEIKGAIGKPLSEVTLHELLACLVAFGYVFSSVMLAEAMLLNLLRVAVRGR